MVMLMHNAWRAGTRALADDSPRNGLDNSRGDSGSDSGSGARGGSVGHAVADLATRDGGATIPLSLYVHLPWCIRKCPYCDFNAYPLRQALDQPRYVRALLVDLDNELARLEFTGHPRRLESIFFGGGTPSLFSGAQLGNLLRAIHQRLDFAAGMEITLEANPDGLTQQHFSDYLAAGINRLSLGVQSFDAAQLSRLGRNHSAADAEHALGAAVRAGFTNLNIDLMFGLPEQGIAAAVRDLDTALSLRPTHISLYQLSIEPQTPFYRSRPQLPCEDTLLAMQQRLQQRLQQAGFAQYEVSAYARQRCRHNTHYWQFGDYLGIGAGAHGKLTRGKLTRGKLPTGKFSTGRRDAVGPISRNWKLKQPQRYLRALESGPRNAQAGQRLLSATDATFEFLMNALRLKHGFSRTLYQARTGQDWSDLVRQLARPLDAGLLVVDAERIYCSRRGYWLLDTILAELS